jgi:hypothetical protein
MWIFDGEEWTQEGVSEEKRKPESVTVPFDMFLPELQVVEIVPTPRKPVPFPLP